MSKLKTPLGDTEHSIAGVLARTRDAAEGEETTVRHAVESLGRVSYSALILVPALLVVTPLSGIPGLSTVLGLTIALVSGQAVVGSKSLWLPEWILQRKVKTTKLKRALAYLEKPAGFVDRYTRQRLQLLVRPPARTGLQLACLFCGLAMPFLEFVPFSSSILGAAVSFFATALVARDGLLAAVGLLLVGGAATVAITALV